MTNRGDRLVRRSSLSRPSVIILRQPKRKRGRPRKGKERKTPPPERRLERQPGQSLAEHILMLWGILAVHRT